MTTAFQKVYTKITQITKATCTLNAQGVGNDELAIVDGRLAQVVKIWGNDITLQVFSGTEGIPTNAEVTFLGKAPTLRVGDDLCGRFFNAFGDPIDGGPAVDGEEREIGGPSVNPVRRKQPSELIATGIAGIDLNNTLVSGQKIPFFADPDQPYNQVMANVALRAQTDRIILGGMGLTNDDYLYFKNLFDNAGVLDRIVSFAFVGTGHGFDGCRVFCGGQERESIGVVDGHDVVCRCSEYRVQPYGSDPVEGLHAGFIVFRFGEDLREGRAVPCRRFYHDHSRDHVVWR